MKRKKEWRWFDKNLGSVPIDNEEKEISKWKYLVPLALKRITHPEYMTDELLSVGYYNLVKFIRYERYNKLILEKNNKKSKNFFLHNIKGRMIRKLDRELFKKASVSYLDASYDEENDIDAGIQLSSQSATYSVKWHDHAGVCRKIDITPSFSENSEKITQKKELIKRIFRILSKLSDKRQEAIKKFYGLDDNLEMSISEISREINVSLGTVYYRIKQGINIIKEQYKLEYGANDFQIKG